MERSWYALGSKILQFKTMVNSSLLEAQFLSQEQARRNKAIYPLAAESALESTYIDDTMDSTLGDVSGIQLYQELLSLWGLADMHARKWPSNSASVLQQIPGVDSTNEIDLDSRELPSVKTLGVV